MPPFVFISGSRGTLTATCRACCGHVFLSCALSPLSYFSSFYIQYLEDAMRLTPVLGGLTPERRETRSESLFPSQDGSSRVRATARVSHAPVAPIMIMLYFLVSLSSRFAFIIYVCAPSSIYLYFFNISYLIASV